MLDREEARGQIALCNLPIVLWISVVFSRMVQTALNVELEHDLCVKRVKIITLKIYKVTSHSTLTNNTKETSPLVLDFVNLRLKFIILILN